MGIKFSAAGTRYILCGVVCVSSAAALGNDSSQQFDIIPTCFLLTLLRIVSSSLALHDIVKLRSSDVLYQFTYTIRIIINKRVRKIGYGPSKTYLVKLN